MNTNRIKPIAIALLATASAFAHSESIKPEFVDTLLSPYFELQASLAGDDLAAAKANATALQAAIGKGASAQKASSIKDLVSGTQNIVDSTDIKAARNAFHMVSKELGSIVDHVGTTGKSDVIKMMCPMAFGGKGGEWLQNNDDLANPYFGSMMYKCGSIVEQLADATK